MYPGEEINIRHPVYIYEKNKYYMRINRILRKQNIDGSKQTRLIQAPQNKSETKKISCQVSIITGLAAADNVTFAGVTAAAVHAA